MSNNNDFVCNVLIMGKTGTGKSSLLNYLCGQKVADTGTGKPVTGEGIYESDVKINGQAVRLFDSWGIESGKTDRWYELIDNALKNHGVQKDMEDWFHCVIYCIQAGGGRVEDFDSAIIKKFLGEGYHLTIVLTKADQIAEDEESKMKKAILNDIKGSVKAEKQGLLKVVSTCAEEKKTRSGITQPFGREDALETIFSGWRETIVDRMPKHIIEKINEEVDGWADRIKYKIDNEWNISGFGNADLEKEIKKDAEHFFKDLQDIKAKEILTNAIESCKKINAELGNAFKINMDNSLFDNKDSDENIVFIISMSLLGGIAWPIVLPACIYMAFSKKEKEKERSKLKEGVQEIADKIKLEIGKHEEEFAKAIEKALC